MANGFNIKRGTQHVDFFNVTPAADIAEGDTVLVGNRIGLYDLGYKAADGAQCVSIGFGEEAEFALADVDGASASTAGKTLVYATSAGALTTTATSNTLVGAVTFAASDVVRVLFY